MKSVTARSTVGISDSQRIAYQTRILDLAESCPFNAKSPCTCPWHEIREKTLSQKHEWVRALSDERMLEMLGYHKLCSEGPLDRLTASG